MTGIHAKYDKIWVWKDPHKNYSLEKKSWAKWSVKIKELAVPAMDHCRSSLMSKKNLPWLVQGYTESSFNLLYHQNSKLMKQ